MRHTISRYWVFNTTVATVFFVAMVASWQVNAVEGGSGFYLLGGKGSLAGVLAPAGTFYSLDSYFYSGDTSANQVLPTLGGELEVGLDADVIVALPSVLRVTDLEVFNGRLAFGAVVPVLNQDVSVDLTLDIDGEVIGGSESDKDTQMGDPVLLAILGWNEGNLHTTLNMMLNVPVGDYEEGDLINGGFNRWGLDTTVAFTYMDPDTGLELTVAPGITLNGKNRDTDYRSGDEFHIEFAAMQHLSEKYAIGLAGYHYEQIDNDSGSAQDGYKGRVSAIGPAGNFNFKLGNVPVYGKAKYLYETNVRNRMEGSAVYLSFSITL
ncbi:MAG: transporter [Oceanicoccus sp.]